MKTRCLLLVAVLLIAGCARSVSPDTIASTINAGYAYVMLRADDLKFAVKPDTGDGQPILDALADEDYVTMPSSDSTHGASLTDRAREAIAKKTWYTINAPGDREYEIPIGNFETALPKDADLTGRYVDVRSAIILNDIGMRLAQTSITSHEEANNFDWPFIMFGFKRNIIVPPPGVTNRAISENVLQARNQLLRVYLDHTNGTQIAETFTQAQVDECTKKVGNGNDEATAKARWKCLKPFYDKRKAALGFPDDRPNT